MFDLISCQQPDGTFNFVNGTFIAPNVWNIANRWHSAVAALVTIGGYTSNGAIQLGVVFGFESGCRVVYSERRRTSTPNCFPSFVHGTAFYRCLPSQELVKLHNNFPSNPGDWIVLTITLFSPTLVSLNVRNVMNGASEQTYVQCSRGV